MIGNKPFFQKETSERRNEFVAVIVYGWEKPKFYAEWFGDSDPMIIIAPVRSIAV